nr:hypothetical protein [Halothiobacillus sp.]
IKDAVAFIRANYATETEVERLRAAYDFTRQRFMHFMYPHHTWLTNPYLALAEKVFPEKPYNGMYGPNATLRHSAVAHCSQAASVFISIYREMGGGARFVSLQGHNVAEANVKGVIYMVDPDLEALTSYSVEEIHENLHLVPSIYSHRSAKEVKNYQAIFSMGYHTFSFHDVPSNSPRIYKVNVLLESAKWFLPITIVLFGVVLMLWRSWKT